MKKGDRTLIPAAAAEDYATTAAWPEDTRIDDAGTMVLNMLGYPGPGAWADLEGGLMLAGMIDADVDSAAGRAWHCHAHRSR